MYSVTVEKNQKSAPTPLQLTKALTEVGGSVSSVEGNNAARKIDYTGVVNHNSFQNKLEEIAQGSKASWNFVWADSIARAINMAEELGLNLSIHQFNRHSQSFGSGRHLRRSLMARRRPRVNQESRPRASLAGGWSDRFFRRGLDC